MGTVLWQLGQLGYGFAYRVLDARYLGVPQRRRRVLIVGCLGDPACAAEVLLEPEGGAWHPAASREERQDIAGTLGGGAGERGWAADTDRMTVVPKLAPTLPSFSASARGSTTNPHFADHALVASSLKANPEVFTRATTTYGPLEAGDPDRWEEADVASPRTSHSPVARELVVTGTLAPGAHPDGLTGREAESGQLVVSRPLTAHPAGSRLGGESDQFVVSPTLGGGNYGAGNLDEGVPNVVAGAMAAGSVRRLTPLECERLQGFPDGWTEGFADSVRYRMLGNAVAVPMAEWVLRRLARAAAQR